MIALSNAETLAGELQHMPWLQPIALVRQHFQMQKHVAIGQVFRLNRLSRRVANAPVAVLNIRTKKLDGLTSRVVDDHATFESFTNGVLFLRRIERPRDA